MLLEYSTRNRMTLLLPGANYNTISWYDTHLDSVESTLGNLIYLRWQSTLINTTMPGYMDDTLQTQLREMQQLLKSASQAR